MPVHIATSDSLIDVLDRVLDKSIMFESWVRINVVGISMVITEKVCGSFVLSSVAVYEGYGKDSRKRELLDKLLPYWRQDLWMQYPASRRAMDGPRTAAAEHKPHAPRTSCSLRSLDNKGVKAAKNFEPGRHTRA